jgi:hypothetical protein
MGNALLWYPLTSSLRLAQGIARLAQVSHQPEAEEQVRVRKFGGILLFVTHLVLLC